MTSFRTKLSAISVMNSCRRKDGSHGVQLLIIRAVEGCQVDTIIRPRSHEVPTLLKNIHQTLDIIYTSRKPKSESNNGNWLHDVLLDRELSAGNSYIFIHHKKSSK